jgi:hypothetical protein
VELTGLEPVTSCLQSLGEGFVGVRSCA